MKTYRSKLLIFPTCLLFSLLLVGCGGQRTGQPESDSDAGKTAAGTDWRASYCEMALGSEENVLDIVRTDGMTFAACQRAETGKDRYRLRYVRDNKLWQEGETVYFDGMSIEMESGQSPELIFSDHADTLYLISCRYEETGSRYFLYTVSSDGKQADSREVTDAFREAWGKDGATITAGAVDQDGRIYIGDFGNKCSILVLEGDGSMSAILSLADMRMYDMTSSGGVVYGAGMAQGGETLFVIDGQQKKIEQVAALPESRGTILLRPGQDGTVLYGYYDALYRYDPLSQTGEDLYTWSNAGINGREVADFYMDREGRICVFTKWDIQTESISAILLQEKKTETVVNADAAAVQQPQEPEKEVIVLCGNAWNAELTRTVGRFNVQSDKYKVEMRDYDNDRLLAEIMAGNGPDLIPLTGGSLSDYVQRGAIEDLAPYLDSSDVLSEEMLNAKVLEAYTVDGILACVPPEFCVSTLFGRESELGSEPGWTVEEFLEYVEAHRGCTIMEGMMKGDSRLICMLTLWRARTDQWVDWEQGVARFGEGEFRELLEYAASYEALYDEGNGNTPERWRDGKLTFLTYVVSDIEMYMYYQALSEGDIVAIGYPTWDGSPCNEIIGYNGLGINRASQHKEGAWEFIEYLLLNQTPEDPELGIPTLNSALEKMIVETTSWGEKKNFSGYQLKQPTEEEIQEFLDLIDNAEAGSQESLVITGILEEELLICFEGGRSVEETVNVIQNRVQLYLDELK